MGSLEKRIGSLEGRIGPKPPRSPWQKLEREAIIAKLRRFEETHGPIREVAEREAAAGYPQKLRALLELEERVGLRRSKQPRG
jgi:hypothetical protein